MNGFNATQAHDLPSTDLAARPVAVLRGTARGLEIHVAGGAELDPMCDAIMTRLAEAPGFFRNSDVRVRVDDVLPRGALARLDAIAEQFELRIVEIGASRAKLDAVPRAHLAAGSAPASLGDDEITTQGPPPTPSRAAEAALEVAAPDLTAPELAVSEPAAPELVVSPPAVVAAASVATTSGVVAPVIDPTLVTIAAEIAAAPAPLEREQTKPVARAQLAELLDEPRTKVVVGPIRSGVILSHPGHIVVFGDVNPGAEVRAEGNIIVLGRLRGTAHAGIGGATAFILALRLEPQQLRIGRQVARAGDDAAGAECEIAHVVGEAITVEHYLGKLPRNLAASLV
ncbi:MAG: hypothetical protein NT062_04725 [Proteobacteria bacterium]|nr:hypothetical protein [Pseudomonadota bacterium]